MWLCSVIWIGSKNPCFSQLFVQLLFVRYVLHTLKEKAASVPGLLNLLVVVLTNILTGSTITLPFAVHAYTGLKKKNNQNSISCYSPHFNIMYIYSVCVLLTPYSTTL